MKFSLITFIIVNFLFTPNLNAQLKIQGHVKDSKGNGIEKASVVVYGDDNSILAYNYTDESGDFLLNLKNYSRNYLIVQANSLGYYKKSDTLIIESNIKSYSAFFQLKESLEQLNEVVLKSTQKISGNGNITTIQTSAFTDQTEQTVEDVLKKLPGIEVLENGSIKAHGKFIDKLLIDGEDMFSNDYQVLSKNLDAKVLGAVQIYDEFQDNPVLARVLESDRVALNLQLKEEFKNIWFGNISLGLGTEERIKTSANVGLLKKKIKFFYFGDYNNLGFKAANQLSGSLSSINISSAYQEKMIEPTLEPLYVIDKKENNLLKGGQSTFNKAWMNSLGFVTKLTPDIELRGTGIFTNDIQNQFFTSETTYNVPQEKIQFSEISDTYLKNTIGAGELEVKYTGGEKSYIRNVLVYENKPRRITNNLLFNEQRIDQILKQEEYSFYNHFNHSLVLNKDQVWHNYIHLGQNNITQNLDLQSPVLNKLFSLESNSKIQQDSNDQLSSFGISSNLFSNFGDFKHHLEVSYESLREKRTNKFLAQNSDNLFIPDSLQNNLSFNQNNIKLKTSLAYAFSEKVKLSLGLSLEHVNVNTDINQKKDWFFNPEINLDLRKLKMGRFNLSYANSLSLPEASFLLPNYRLNSYRSFVQGIPEINFIKRDTYNFYYKWANELESQAVSFRLKYATANKDYSTKNKLNQDFILAEYQFVKGSEQISGSLNYTSYYENLNLSTNLRTTQNWLRTPIQINNSGFKILKNYNATYQFSGTTYFDFPVNFNFDVQLNFSESQFNEVFTKTNWQNLSLNLSYALSDQWKASVENSFYQMESQSYYFLNSTINFQPKKSDFSYQLSMNNLMDENKFSTTFIDEYVIYTSEIKLLPRYLFISAKYRF